jgi:hypothetical protein
MKKGYRLSSFNAYSNYQIYKQVNQANFGWQNTLGDAAKDAWGGIKSTASQVKQGVGEGAEALGTKLTGGIENHLQGRSNVLGTALDNMTPTAASTPEELAKLAKLKKTKSNLGAANQFLQNNRQGIGYGAMGLGALGVGGAGLVAANAMGQKPQQY